MISRGIDLGIGDESLNLRLLEPIVIASQDIIEKLSKSWDENPFS